MTYTDKSSMFFLGGIFVDEQINFVANNSIGNIQNAADSFQKKLICGLESASGGGLTVINFPFVGSYPRLFGKIFFPSYIGPWLKKSKIVGGGFLNLFGIKIVGRFVSALMVLSRVIDANERSILFVYSAHLPFLLAVEIYKYFNSNLKVCLIVPDLPEFMSDGGFIYRFFKAIDSFCFYYLARKLDFFVVLTKQMAKRMNLEKSQFIVVEGISSGSAVASDSLHIDLSKRYFLYTGTLARRYGIVNLITAFSDLKHDDFELWICGDGDGRDDVIDASRRVGNIKYLGMLTHPETIFLQKNAFALVNPRQAVGDYTRYSFPSKIMEYMVTGRPLLMYKMEGIPDEYDAFYFSPSDNSVESLTKCLAEIANCDAAVLSQMGVAARNFVLSNKSESVQAKRILDFISKGN